MSVKIIQAWKTADGVLLRDVQQVEVWETSEHTLFEHESEARVEEACIVFNRWYEALNEEEGLLDEQGNYDSIAGRTLANWLIVNRTRIVSFLTAYTRAIKSETAADTPKEAAAVVEAHAENSEPQPIPSTLHDIAEAKGLDATYRAAKAAYLDPEGEEEEPPKADIDNDDDNNIVIEAPAFTVPHTPA